LIDGVGSYHFKKDIVKKLNERGVEVHHFFPVFPSFFRYRMNYRNHRKMLIVDGKIGFMGGLNIGDEYMGKDPKLGYWRDTHLMMKGSGVYLLQASFLADWCFLTKQQLQDEDRLFPIHHVRKEQPIQMITGG